MEMRHLEVGGDEKRRKVVKGDVLNRLTNMNATSKLPGGVCPRSWWVLEFKKGRAMEKKRSWCPSVQRLSEPLTTLTSRFWSETWSQHGEQMVETSAHRDAVASGEASA